MYHINILQIIHSGIHTFSKNVIYKTFSTKQEIIIYSLRYSNWKILLAGEDC